MSQLRENLRSISEGQIKSNIERIIASYRNEWDIFTELIQNSADAVIDQFGFENISNGIITIKISTDERKLEVSDNGIGINEEDISKILVTGESLKRNEGRGKYGFMGYGLTFIAFQSSYINITSVKDGIKSSRTYQDLYKCIYGNQEIPESNEEINGVQPIETREPNGTSIIVEFPKDFPEESVENNLMLAFAHAKNHELFKHILRTNSAIGLVDPIFSGQTNKTDLNIQYELNIDEQPVEIKNYYLTTREIVSTIYPNERRIYDIERDYPTYITMSEHFPFQQQKETRKATLLDIIIEDIEFGAQPPLKARIYLASTSKDNLNTYKKVKMGEDAPYEITNGLWLAINGLPTGIMLDKFEHANYLPFSGVVDVQNDKIRNELDAGRKGITEYRAKQITEKVRENLRKYNFIKHKMYVINADSRIGNPLYDPKEELEKALRKKKEYAIDLTHIAFPPLEEQEVISLFTELIAKDYLKGYYEKVLSGYQVYDGLYKYELPHNEDTKFTPDNELGIRDSVFDANGGTLRKNILIEFKRRLLSIYKDIDDNKKDISQIDVLVCWDVEYEKKDSILTDFGDALVEVNKTDSVFYGVTHQLITTKRQRPLPIIELKRVVEYLFKIKIEQND
ncbi:ATP-binding protein [Bacillus pacificus]|uniref:ATP-binding protein n=1 Tax=Bacillus pacificus TaxID=2026187 RepID=UPI0027E76FC8|nr:ATP-binding protein [Bacillus pacificus]MDQ7236425.1 ATP-binding protein [Bacillus pacificus]MDQ7239571.1 ATP-binding protein [Bacillus pacificus]